MKKRLSVAVVLGLLLAAMVATPASAVGLPCGNVCDGKDPQTYHVLMTTHDPDVYVICASGAITVKSVTVNTYQLLLRYSPHCETTWIKVKDLVTGANIPHSEKMVSTYLGGGVRTTLRGSYSSGPWSYMLNDHNLLNYGCIYTYLNEYDLRDGIVYQSDCTDSY